MIGSSGIVRANGAAAPAYTAQGVNFDGSNDNLLTASSSMTAPSAGTKSGLISFWIRMGGGDGNVQQILNAGFFEISRHSDNKIRLLAAGSMDWKSNSTVTANATWYHVLASWDLASSLASVYLTGSSDGPTSPTLINANIDYSGGFWIVGCNSGGTQRLNADLADLWFNPGTYLDLSNSTNRAKFISGGAPVDLGSDGSTPTGSAPFLFLKGTTASWHTNKGTGGGLGLTGTLTDSSSNPP
jgi:hypothetical protein